MFLKTRTIHCVLSITLGFCCLKENLFARETSHKAHPLESYLLPSKDPLNKPLSHLFYNPHMFRSPHSLAAEGFDLKVSHNKLMIAGHSKIPHHLIKKFTDSTSQTTQLKNFLKRIKGARILRNCIKKYQLKHITVPEKWLYQLPSIFHGYSYVLVVEKMDIYDDWDNPKGEARKLYYNMDKEILEEFCILLHAVGGCDSIPRNQPFTHSGQLAFIDTEHVGERKEHFYKHILPALNPELQAYATAFWEKLEAEKKEK